MTGMRNIEEEEEGDLPTPGETGAVYDAKHWIKFQIVTYCVNIKQLRSVPWKGNQC